MRLKVDKDKFDATFKRLLQSKPIPRAKIKSKGKRGPKTPILSRP